MQRTDSFVTNAFEHMVQQHIGDGSGVFSGTAQIRISTGLDHNTRTIVVERKMASRKLCTQRIQAAH
ncbi:hypothetical protein A7D27_10500 [Pseudomonas sp. 1D4]|nr:hypothetical protein A7D27_10500 [Pseudomonas sp. 1D4]